MQANQDILHIDGSVTQDDYTWVIEEEATLAENSIVSVAHLDKLDAISGKKGVFITVDDDLENLLAEDKLPLNQLDIIAINFANFNDGRGYSYASLLKRAGYQGELRAVGDVFKDTLFYMKRCGFVSFILKADKSLEEAKAGFSDFSAGYQAIQTASSNFQTGI